MTVQLLMKSLRLKRNITLLVASIFFFGYGLISFISDDKMVIIATMFICKIVAIISGVASIVLHSMYKGLSS